MWRLLCLSLLSRCADASSLVFPSLKGGESPQIQATLVHMQQHSVLTEEPPREAAGEAFSYSSPRVTQFERLIAILLRRPARKNVPNAAVPLLPSTMTSMAAALGRSLRRS